MVLALRQTLQYRVARFLISGGSAAVLNLIFAYVGVNLLRFRFWLAADSPAGVFYVPRGCTEQFTQEDLH